MATILFAVTPAVPTTPLLQLGQKKKTLEEMKSPPTPHRIELRRESVDEVNCKKICPVGSIQPVPKSRRK